MRRFLRLMSLAIQGKMYYRVGFLLNLLTPLVMLAGQFMLWGSLYGEREGAQVGEYARADMFSYILLAFAINSLLTWSSENVLSREIRSGMVIARRIRPVPFLLQSVAEMCGNMLLQAVVNFTVVAVVFFLFAPHLTLPVPANFGLFLLSLALAMALRMLLVSCFSLLCFFTTGHLGLTWTRTALTEFFSGALIPVALFPVWLKTVAYLLPFPLMLQVPVSIFLGQDLAISLPLTFALQGGWILVFLGLHALLYGHIRKNTTLAGG